ncbi:MAG TPA: hypothetical protein VF765_15330 [Polyangiaceae bacterium]
MTVEAWYSWAAIGVAASLGGMIWAFRRGVFGVLANFAAGIGGALLGGALAAASAPHAVFRGPAIPGIPAPAGPSPMFFAAVGAIAALLVLHVVWIGVLVMRGRQAPAR